MDPPPADELNHATWVWSPMGMMTSFAGVLVLVNDMAIHDHLLTLLPHSFDDSPQWWLQ